MIFLTFTLEIRRKRKENLRLSQTVGPERFSWLSWFADFTDHMRALFALILCRGLLAHDCLHIGRLRTPVRCHFWRTPSPRLSNFRSLCVVFMFCWFRKAVLLSPGFSIQSQRSHSTEVTFVSFPRANSLEPQTLLLWAKVVTCRLLVNS